MSTEVITSFQQICDSSGNPLSGAKINVYDVGTTTPKTVYSDTGLSVSVANPIVTDSAGRHAMRYIATGSYKIVVNTSADVLVYERDNIDGRVPVGSGALAIANGGTGATTAGAALTALGGATAAELADVSAEVAALSGTLASSEKTHIATGTTAQRPATPVEGDVRRNTTLTTFEGYNGSAWVNFAVLPTSQTDPSATDSAEGFIEIAVQSEMETATDTTRAVVPGRQQYHPSAAKMWGRTTGGGTPSLSVSYNVASITDLTTGFLRVTIDTDFSSTSYPIVATIETNTARLPMISDSNRAVGSIDIVSLNTGGSGADPDTGYNFVALGDQ